MAGPAAQMLREHRLDPAAVHWLQTNFLKTELELGHCLRLPAEGPCECDLVLSCSKFVTTTDYAPRLRARLAVGQQLIDDATTRGRASEVERHQATSPPRAAASRARRDATGLPRGWTRSHAPTGRARSATRWRLAAGARGPGGCVISARRDPCGRTEEPAAGDLSDQRPGGTRGATRIRSVTAAAANAVSASPSRVASGRRPPRTSRSTRASHSTPCARRCKERHRCCPCRRSGSVGAGGVPRSVMDSITDIGGRTGHRQPGPDHRQLAGGVEGLTGSRGNLRRWVRGSPLYHVRSIFGAHEGNVCARRGSRGWLCPRHLG